ncbi:MAG: formylglycine-generating enzyme family protein [bacterium]|nr:formylglycine-generating enzyme family protein [bacterium]
MDFGSISRGRWLGAWKVVGRPEWAHDAGRDEYGFWIEVEIEDAAFRLRWIPPGRFRMGSPETEAGRWDDESPRHEVVLTRGFWLGETPCTQALWRAVTGEDPSRFKSPDRPVEQVSWEDCRAFCDQLNEKIPELEARLPTEAEWEYACRAGTETATYAGEMEILGHYNAPVVDDVAWYGGNSGVDFELENGQDSSDWPEKQYPHERAGTHPVAQKKPNDWGLYDKLGNVWEWCEDSTDLEPYDRTRSVQDPVSRKGSLRVFRGGSWYYSARFVRAAARFAYVPGLRYDYLGFRLARGQRKEEEPMARADKAKVE